MKTLLSLILLLGGLALGACQSTDEQYEVQDTETISVAVPGVT